MNDPKIIICLSGKEISIYLSKEKGASAPLSLLHGDGSVMLEHFGGKEAASPLFKIGKKADALLRKALDEEVPGWLDNHSKEDLPVILLLDNDIDDAGKKSVLADLSRWGFDKVKVSRSDTVLFDYLNKEYDYEGLVSVGSDGRNLFVSMYSAENPATIERKTLQDAANDNRLEAVAMKIWEQVSDYTLDLDMETEFPALRREAEDFLASGRSEKEGNVRLSDGDTYSYFLNRRMLKDLGEDRVSLDRVFTEIMLDNGLHDRSRMAIVLRTHAIGSFYLKENLTNSFDRVYEETDSVLNEVLKRVATLHWDKISENVNPKFVKDRIPPTPVSPNNEPTDKVAPSTETDDEKEDSPKNKKNSKSDLIPVVLTASVKKEKAGMFKKKNVLTINVDFPETNKLKWASVLCVQDDPLVIVEPQNIVKSFDRGDKGPFTIKVDLPLSSCPNARQLRVYFKPDPDEPVGINNAYICDPCTVDIG